MEDYELVERFEKLWPILPKNIPLLYEESGKASYVLVFAVESLRVYVELQVGVKGGINELVYVFDSSQRITADRLIVQCFDGRETEGVFFSLIALRSKVFKTPKNRKQKAQELCNDALWDFAEKIDTSPPTARSLRLIASTSQSLKRVIQGGIPSQGRLGGGGGASR